VTTTSSTSSTSSVVSAAANSILTSLGAGSGIDTSTMITQLVAANKATKQAAIDGRTSQNTAQISALATVKSGVDGFASALQTLTASGQLMTQPTSTDAGVAAVSAIAGTHVGDLSATLQVIQLAQAQTIEATGVIDPSAAIGQGSMTLTTPKGSFTVTIDSSNDSLTGLAAAINKTNSGVTASIVQDGTGYRLVLKGQTGAASGFAMTANGDASAGLAAFAYGGADTATMTQAQGAQDAIVKLDGVQVTRASNTISDLVAGTQIALKTTGTIALGSDRPTDAISEAVNDFVTAYNSLRKAIDETTAAATATTSAGALNGNSSIRDLETMLAKLTSTQLSSYGNTKTLAEIGVSTNQDGTLALDANKLSTVLAADPDGVESMFSPGQQSSSPLLTITSAIGATKPGTYTITNVVAAGNGATNASAMIGSTAALANGNQLFALYGTPAYGLTFSTSGTVASATITVDPGLYGAVALIQSALEASTGLITTLQSSFNQDASEISDDQTKLDAQSQAYQDQLTTQFTSMQAAVTSYKSIQSYLTQQVALWTKSN
jgi:flagellar hook-associated protein 2